MNILFGFKILNAFRGDAKGGIDAMTESIRNLNVTGIVEELKVVIKFMGILLKVAGGVAKAFDKIGTFIGETAAKFVLGNVFSDAAGQGFSLLDAFGGGGKEAPQRVGPNQQEASARSARETFKGTLDISGAPEGSTLETGPAPSGFQVALLGNN